MSGWSGEEANKRTVEWERGRENEEMGKREKKWEREGKRKATKESETRERKREGSTISFGLYVELQQDGIAARLT